MIEGKKDRIYTRGEREIHSFVNKYGMDELISWLGEYTKNISPKDYSTYHRIKKAVCKEFNIPIADLNGQNIMDDNARLALKIVSYLTRRHSRLHPKDISKLQHVSTRSIYNHNDSIKDIVKNPRTAYGGFLEKFANITKELNYE